MIDYLIPLLTLVLMEIVLGVDNIVFITILVGRVPAEKRDRIRNLGLIGALGIRFLLLFSINWIMSLSTPFVRLYQWHFSGRDLILLIGGLFLIGKATYEIHHKISDDPHDEVKKLSSAAAGQVLMQIILLDIVFSLDSVITAVGMVQDLSIMVIAMIIAMLVMLVSAKKIGEFVDAHPTLKILALSFLILIGVMLTAEGMGQHLGKGYIYFAMGFSLTVEFINMKIRQKKR